MNTRRTLASIFVGAVAAGSAQAALHDRGGGLIYDDVLNVTWLQDANYAQTSGYNADGLMTWGQATTWAANLVYGGYDDWRLPTTTDTGTTGCNFAYTGTDCGFNVDPASSEMAHLFFTELGNVSEYDTIGRSLRYGGSLINTGPFINFQSDFYWSGTEYVPSPGNGWSFNTNHGSQGFGSKASIIYALAVRDGDVAAVPEPETYVMFLGGLGLVGVMARRRKSS